MITQKHIVGSFVTFDIKVLVGLLIKQIEMGTKVQ